MLVAVAYVPPTQRNSYAGDLLLCLFTQSSCSWFQWFYQAVFAIVLEAALVHAYYHTPTQIARSIYVEHKHLRSSHSL